MVAKMKNMSLNKFSSVFKNIPQMEGEVLFASRLKPYITYEHAYSSIVWFDDIDHCVFVFDLHVLHFLYVAYVYTVDILS